MLATRRSLSPTKRKKKKRTYVLSTLECECAAYQVMMAVWSRVFFTGQDEAENLPRDIMITAHSAITCK